MLAGSFFLFILEILHIWKFGELAWLTHSWMLTFSSQLPLRYDPSYFSQDHNHIPFCNWTDFDISEDIFAFRYSRELYVYVCPTKGQFMSPKLRANVLCCLSSKHLSMKADTSVALAYTKRQLPGTYRITAALLHSLEPCQLSFERAVETKISRRARGHFFKGTTYTTSLF